MANTIVIGSHSSVVKLLVKLGRLFSNLDLVHTTLRELQSHISNTNTSIADCKGLTESQTHS